MARSAKAPGAFDFIDLGASAGGSLAWGARAFGGTGVGIELSEEKARAARAKGHRVLVGDARKVDLPDACARFVITLDFLEHLGTIDDARLVVGTAHRLARDFVFIALPNFDSEHVLRERGLKRYYTDWSGHSLRLRSGALAEIVAGFPGEAQVFRYGEIFDTWNRCIVPLDAPRNSSFYDPNLHGPRPFEVLPRKLLYERTLAVIVKGGPWSMNDVLMRAVSTLGYLQPINMPASAAA